MPRLTAMRRGSVLLVLVLLGPALTAGCRPETPRTPAPATAPVPEAVPATRPASQPATQTAPATTQDARRFRVTTVGLNPDQPVSLLGKVAGDESAELTAHLRSDHLLVVETRNVDLVRIDLTRLGRGQATRLVIQIDGQGLEVTGRGSRVVHLHRSSVGHWSFTPGPATHPAG